MIADQLLDYHSILSPERTRKLKPNFTGHFLVLRSDEAGFEPASLQFHRMMLQVKMSFCKSEAHLRSPQVGEMGKRYKSLHPAPLGIGKAFISPSFSVFMPEHMIELLMWSPKGSSISSFVSRSILSQKVIRVTNLAGESILIRGRQQKETDDLWHYLYNKGVQFRLPKYIRKRGGEKTSIFQKNEQNGPIFFIDNPSVRKEFKLIEVPLSDQDGVRNAARKWLFDLNIDQVANLRFDRSSCVIIEQGRLIICQSYKNPSPEKFLTTDNLKTSLNSFFQSFEKILLMLKNLESRRIFMSKQFSFDNIAVDDEDDVQIYFKNVEKLVLNTQPNQHKSGLGLVLSKLKTLMEPLKGRSSPFQSPMITQNIKIMAEAHDDLLTSASYSLTSLDQLIAYFRTEMDLDTFSFYFPSQREKIQQKSARNEKGVGIANSLDMELDLEHMHRKRSKRKVEDSDSTFEVDSEGEVENHVRLVQRMRKLEFKNKFSDRKK